MYQIMTSYDRKEHCREPRMMQTNVIQIRDGANLYDGCWMKTYADAAA